MDDIFKAGGAPPTKGIKGIKPISGRFKPKKCVKTVSYRGRPRYICPASGGEEAIHSLENLPVKPEDTPRKLAQIKQYSPEEQYTPKQQREEPEKVKDALLRRPVSIHLQDVDEAGPDQEHDHLHFHSPDEATAKESDAIILKDEKKGSKKKSSEDEDMDKGLYLNNNLFKSSPAKTPPAKTPPAKTPPAKTPPVKSPSAKTPSAKTPSAKTPSVETKYEVVSGKQEIPKQHRMGDFKDKTHREGFKITNDPMDRIFATKDRANKILSEANKFKVVPLPSGKFGVNKDSDSKSFATKNEANSYRFKVANRAASKAVKHPKVNVISPSRRGAPIDLGETVKEKTLGDHLTSAAINTAITVAPVGHVFRGAKYAFDATKAKAVFTPLIQRGNVVLRTVKDAGAVAESVVLHGKKQVLLATIVASPMAGQTAKQIAVYGSKSSAAPIVQQIAKEGTKQAAKQGGKGASGAIKIGSGKGTTEGAKKVVAEAAKKPAQEGAKKVAQETAKKTTSSTAARRCWYSSYGRRLRGS